MSTVLGLFTTGAVIQTSLWCSACALPSGIAIEIVLINEHGACPYGVMRACIACRGPVEGTG